MALLDVLHADAKRQHNEKNMEFYQFALKLAETPAKDTLDLADAKTLAAFGEPLGMSEAQLEGAVHAVRRHSEKMAQRAKLEAMKPEEAELAEALRILWEEHNAWVREWRTRAVPVEQKLNTVRAAVERIGGLKDEIERFKYEHQEYFGIVPPPKPPLTPLEIRHQNLTHNCGPDSTMLWSNIRDAQDKEAKWREYDPNPADSQAVAAAKANMLAAGLMSTLAHRDEAGKPHACDELTLAAVRRFAERKSAQIITARKEKTDGQFSHFLHTAEMSYAVSRALWEIHKQKIMELDPVVVHACMVCQTNHAGGPL